jgi:hypothetical protein
MLGPVVFGQLPAALRMIWVGARLTGTAKPPNCGYSWLPVMLPVVAEQTLVVVPQVLVPAPTSDAPR